MKKIVYSISCCLLLLITALSISCKQEISPQMVTIQYASQDGSLSTKRLEVVKGSKLTSTELPTLNCPYDNSLFDGWYKDKGCTKKWDKNNDIATEDITLYYKWRNFIGDIILRDGSMITRGEYNEHKEDFNSNPAIAVAFGKNSKGQVLGVGVSSIDAEYNFNMWYTDLQNCPKVSNIICTPSISDYEDKNISELDSFIGDVDGSDNWDEICKVYPKILVESDNINNPFNLITKFVNNNLTNCSEDLKKGWYIPSIAELVKLLNNKENVNKSLYNLYDTEIINKNNLINLDTKIRNYFSSSQNDNGKFLTVSYNEQNYHTEISPTSLTFTESKCRYIRAFTIN